MRTKTLLLTAAVAAVGLAGAAAQSVYSVNAVGYVNVSLVPGYNLVSNPLNGTNNTINTILPSVPDQTIASRWDAVNQTFLPADTFFIFGPNDPANGWYDSGFNPSATVINPGEGFFLQSPSAATITFVGEVPQGGLTNTIGANFGFYSSIVPQAANLMTIGFPEVDQLQFSTWDSVNQTYSSALTYFVFGPNDPANGFYDSGFNPAVASSAVGAGFLLFNPGAPLNWTRTFSVN
jgi:hypothetical protein